eukprot:766973-Hanusia_phi.AAC.8
MGSTRGEERVREVPLSHTNCLKGWGTRRFPPWRVKSDRQKGRRRRRRRRREREREREREKEIPHREASKIQEWHV